MLLPESTHALAVGVLLVVLFIGFVREWVKPDVAALTAVALLLVTSLLTPAKVLGVFSNSAPFTIACLFIISGALSRTGCVDWLGERIAQAAGRSEGRLLVGLLLVGLVLVGLVVSPFINNTPVVMVMIPVVIGLATRLSLSPSRLLIPLSYATILGGTVTLVGTSTNILVDGVARSMGLEPFSMFEITAPALLIALLGCGFMLLFARRWLPARETLMEEFASGAARLDTPRQRDVVIVEALVGQTSRYVLRPIRDLDLASRYGIRLIAVHRKNVSMADMDDDFQLQFGDVLLVEGAPSQIQRFCDNGDLFAITERKPALQRRNKAPVAVGTMVGVMALAALDVMPIEGLALIGAVLVVLTSCLKPEEAYKSIEWPILMLIKRIEASGGNSGPNYSRSSTTQPFYSALSREMEGLNLKSAPVVGWNQALLGLVKNGKVNQDEIEWSGLKDWLGLQTGKVAKEDVMAFLNANGVQVQEVVLGQDAPKANLIARKVANIPKGELENLPGSDYFEPQNWLIFREDGDFVRQINGTANNAQEAVDVFRVEADEDGYEGVRGQLKPKYAQYTLPGGENYREVLLTLPGKPKTEMVPIGRGPLS